MTFFLRHSVVEHHFGFIQSRAVSIKFFLIPKIYASKSINFLFIFAVSQKDHKNCRIQLVVVVIYRKLKQNRKKNDDDDAVHKLCSQSSQSADC